MPSAALPQELQGFIDKLIDEKDLGSIDADIREQVTEDLSGRLEDRINLAILEHMPEDQLQAFNDILDTGDSNQISEFVNRSIPNLDQVISSALLSFRQVYLGI